MEIRVYCVGLVVRTYFATVSVYCVEEINIIKALCTVKCGCYLPLVMNRNYSLAY